MHKMFIKDMIIYRTWLISQKKSGDVLRALVPFVARLARQDAVGPADRGAQHDCRVRSERRLLWRNSSLGVSESKRAAAPAPDQVTAVALPDRQFNRQTLGDFWGAFLGPHFGIFLSRQYTIWGIPSFMIFCYVFLCEL